jgi:hypothetical protein
MLLAWSPPTLSLGGSALKNRNKIKIKNKNKK